MTGGTSALLQGVLKEHPELKHIEAHLMSRSTVVVCQFSSEAGSRPVLSYAFLGEKASKQTTVLIPEMLRCY